MSKRAIAVILVGLSGACTGTVDGSAGGTTSAPPADRDGDGLPDPTDPNPDVPEMSAGDVKESLAAGKPLQDGAGLRPLERLSRREYANTVKDMLGVTIDVDTQLPADGLGPSGFELPGLVSALEGRALQSLAESLSAAAIKDLPHLLGCEPSAGEEACVTSFLKAFGRRAYRRPLEQAEQDRLATFFQTARGTHTLSEAVRLVVQAILQSPQFLYHFQHDSTPAAVQNGLVALTPYEIASRLSYLVWGSLPDDALLDAADDGSLATPEGLQAELQRLLQNPKAERSIGDFHLQWLSLQNLPTAQKDTDLYPQFSGDLADSMLEETRGFARSIILTGDGSFEKLLSAPSSYINGSLAALYGAAAAPGAPFALVDLDPTQRAGVLTQAAFLTSQASASGSNPILRGKVVYERVACGVTVAPPPNVPPLAPPSPNLTTRERFAQHAANACAKACHEKFDPPGFAFENYDGIGRYRVVENGRPVDASGTIELPLDGPKTFTNAVELAGVLAKSADARQCLVRQWSRYALKRHEVTAELGSLQATYGAFEAAGFDIRALLKRLIATKTFLYRLPAPGEVTK